MISLLRDFSRTFVILVSLFPKVVKITHSNANFVFWIVKKCSFSYDVESTKVQRIQTLRPKINIAWDVIDREKIYFAEGYGKETSHTLFRHVSTIVFLLETPK